MFRDYYTDASMGLQNDSLLSKEVRDFPEKPEAFLGHFQSRGRVVFYWKLLAEPANAKDPAARLRCGYGMLELDCGRIEQVEYLKENDFGFWTYLCSLRGRWVEQTVRTLETGELEKVLFAEWDLAQVRELAASRSWECTTKDYERVWFRTERREFTRDLCDVFEAMKNHSK